MIPHQAVIYQLGKDAVGRLMYDGHGHFAALAWKRAQ